MVLSGVKETAACSYDALIRTEHGPLWWLAFNMTLLLKGLKAIHVSRLPGFRYIYKRIADLKLRQRGLEAASARACLNKMFAAQEC